MGMGMGMGMGLLETVVWGDGSGAGGAGGGGGGGLRLVARDETVVGLEEEFTVRKVCGISGRHVGKSITEETSVGSGGSVLVLVADVSSSGRVVVVVVVLVLLPTTVLELQLERGTYASNTRPSKPHFYIIVYHLILIRTSERT
ncbi:hypothetical protein M0802_005942 [Mischocyttarus mexicanus]|nr:hypothetical protein M0802_005942 [Mischocyttarus mexicanus]